MLKKSNRSENIKKRRKRVKEGGVGERTMRKSKGDNKLEREK